MWAFRRSFAAALVLSLWSSRVVHADNHGVTFQFPPASEKLTFYYLDTINVTYESSFAAPGLFTFCSKSDGTVAQKGVETVPGYNASTLVLLDFNDNVSPCWFDLRPSSSSGAGNGANSNGFVYVAQQRDPSPVTLGAQSSTVSPTTTTTSRSTTAPTSPTSTAKSSAETTAASTGTTEATATATGTTQTAATSTGTTSTTAGSAGTTSTTSGTQTNTVETSASASAATGSTTSAASVSTATASSVPSTGLSTGAQAAIGVVAGVVGVALGALMVFLLMRRRRRDGGHGSGSAEKPGALLNDAAGGDGGTSGPSSAGHPGTEFKMGPLYGGPPLVAQTTEPIPMHGDQADYAAFANQQHPKAQVYEMSSELQRHELDADQYRPQELSGAQWQGVATTQVPYSHNGLSHDQHATNIQHSGIP